MEVTTMTTLEATKPLDALHGTLDVSTLATSKGAMNFYSQVGFHVVPKLVADRSFMHDEERILRKQAVLIDPIGTIVRGMEFGTDGAPVVRNNDTTDKDAFNELVTTLETRQDVSPWELYTMLVEQALNHRYHKTHGVDSEDTNYANEGGAIHAIPAQDVKEWLEKHPLEFGPSVETRALISGSFKLMSEEMRTTNPVVLDVASAALKHAGGA